MSITAGRVTGDTLNFTNQNGITGSYNSATGLLSLTGSATVADYQTALRSITFSSTSDNPTSFGASTSRTISWTSNDGILNSTTVTSTVNVTAVDDAPVVTAGTTVSYTEQGTATTLASTLTVSDVDNTNLAGATVAISAGFLSGDALNFTNQNGITGSYNGSTGVLTLTGSALLATYQTALRSITFSSTSDNPTSFGTDTSRTIGWTASDGTLSSTAATSTVNITAVNDAPVVTAGTTVSFTEQGSAVALSSTLTVSDADNQNLASATVSIGTGFFAGDTLNFTDQNGITGSYNSGTGVLTLTGSATVATYQTALRSITFSSASDNPTNFGSNPSRTISWRANDGTVNSTAANSTVNITAVDDAPVVTAGVTVNYSALGAAVLLDSALTATDADNQTLAGATVSISTNLVTGDSLNFTNQNGITGSYNSGTGVLTLTGSATVGNYQTALRSITYSSTNADPTNGGSESTRTISWTVNDGALDSAAATSTVNVGAPVVVAGATASFTEQGAAVVLDAGLTLTDNDSTNQASATVSISSGFFAGDTLNFTDQNGISGSYDGSTGVLTLTGSSLVANYQAALRSITYSSASDNPTNFGTSASRTITWTANDGTLDSTPATSTLNITAVDDAPVLAAGASVSYTEQGTATVLDFDPDAERCRQPEPGERQGADHLRPFPWRHAELHQPERHQRQLRRQHRHTLPHWQFLGRQLPDGAAVDHLLLDQRQPDQLRHRYQPHHHLAGERRHPGQQRRHQHRDRHRGQRRPRRDGRHDGKLHRAGLGGPALLEPDGNRCRQPEPDERHGLDQLGLLRRRHAEFHRPERHHRQLQQRHRRALAHRQCDGRLLPDGAELDHLLLDQRQPDQLRHRYRPHDQLDGERRRPEQHGRHQHAEHHRDQRCAGG